MHSTWYSWCIHSTWHSRGYTLSSELSVHVCIHSTWYCPEEYTLKQALSGVCTQLGAPCGYTLDLELLGGTALHLALPEGTHSKTRHSLGGLHSSSCYLGGFTLYLTLPGSFTLKLDTLWKKRTQHDAQRDILWVSETLNALLSGGIYYIYIYIYIIYVEKYVCNPKLSDRPYPNDGESKGLSSCMC